MAEINAKREIVIVTDSCSDMYTELREKYNVEYIPMHIMYKGKEVPASLNWGEVFTQRELWDEIATKNRLTTSQINQSEFVEHFTKWLDDGKDIIYIACSSALSASVHSAEKAAEELLPNYPGAKIYCIDALNACKGECMMVIKASELRAEGKSIDEIVSWIEANKLRYNQICTVDDLSYLKRAGRVIGAAAFFGGILQVKPIIVSDIKGHNAPIAKVKGRKNAINFLVERCKEVIENPEEQTLYVSHGDCLADAEVFAEKLREAVHPKDIYIDWLGPIIGATTGPGTLVVYCFGKEETFLKED